MTWSPWGQLAQLSSSTYYGRRVITIKGVGTARMRWLWRLLEGSNVGPKNRGIEATSLTLKIRQLLIIINFLRPGRHCPSKIGTRFDGTKDKEKSEIWCKCAKQHKLRISQSQNIEKEETVEVKIAQKATAIHAVLLITQIFDEWKVWIFTFLNKIVDPFSYCLSNRDGQIIKKKYF